MTKIDLSNEFKTSSTAGWQTNMSWEMAQKRAKLLADIRQFFAKRDVIEVQTPALSQAGNTDVFLHSVAVDAHILGKSTACYLHTSPEFAMKRLLASWHKPIYQICNVYRDNEIGQQHNIEFTMLEWYQPNYSLNQLASELTDLLSKVTGKPQILKHYRYVDAFLDYVGVHPLQTSCQVLKAVAKSKGINGIDMEDDHQGWLDLLFSHIVEPKLGFELPTLITDYPPATASLAKVAIDHEGNEVAKRFELYINGVEIANAYDELADGNALRDRFEQDNVARTQRGFLVMPIDENLLASCDNMPECSGIAVGIDRLLMVITDSKDINQVISFGSQTA